MNPRRCGAGAGGEGGGGGKRPLTLKSWMTIKDVKQTLQTLLHVPMAKQVRGRMDGWIDYLNRSGLVPSYIH